MAGYVSKEMMRFNHLKTETDAAYHEASMKLGLSDSASIILYTICEAGEERPLSEVVAVSALSKQTVNSSLRKLEAEEIICLKAGGGRKKTVCLTEKGKELAGRTVVRMMQAENEIFDQWTDEEKEIYLSLTQRYLNEFREKIKEL